jgi:hypothetical protein
MLHIMYIFDQSLLSLTSLKTNTHYILAYREGTVIRSCASISIFVTLKFGAFRGIAVHYFYVSCTPRWLDSADGF